MKLNGSVSILDVYEFYGRMMLVNLNTVVSIF